MLPLLSYLKSIHFFIAPVLYLLISGNVQAQSFEFNSFSVQRDCLVASEVELSSPKVTLLFLDSLLHASSPLEVYRRPLGSLDWTRMGSSLPSGTGRWEDRQVKTGEIWEYQVKRKNTWSFRGKYYDATGYTIGNLRNESS